MSHRHDAHVMRIVNYGENDVIARLYTLEAGHLSVIAKGARKARTRLAARIEPFFTLRVEARSGKGELAFVESAELIAAHDNIRASYMLQQHAAAGFDTLMRLTAEHEASPPVYHLAGRFLAELDELPGRGGTGEHAAVLLGAFQLKLLLAAGLAPTLGSCVRCGATADITAFSARDGGVVCDSDRVAADQSLSQQVRELAQALLQRPLGDWAEADPPGAGIVQGVSDRIVAPICREHADFAAKRPS